MTDPYGIIDLAALTQPAGGETGGEGSAGTPSAHEVVVTEQGLFEGGEVDDSVRIGHR